MFVAFWIFILILCRMLCNQKLHEFFLVAVLSKVLILNKHRTLGAIEYE